MSRSHLICDKESTLTSDREQATITHQAIQCEAGFLSPMRTAPLVDLSLPLLAINIRKDDHARPSTGKFRQDAFKSQKKE